MPVVTDRLCSIDGCESKRDSHGYCQMHAARWRRWGDPLRESLTFEERFWANVDVRGPDDCWPWLAALSGGSYGQVSVGGVAQRAHRVAHELMVGPIPDGLQLDHACHNRDASCNAGRECQHRRCCNPAHLEPATAQANTLAGRTPAGINALKTHCSQGHPLSGDNLYVQPKGGRVCKTCRRERERVYDKKRRAK